MQTIALKEMYTQPHSAEVLCAPNLDAHSIQQLFYKPYARQGKTTIPPLRHRPDQLDQFEAFPY